jgi:hypothetical protein
LSAMIQDVDQMSLEPAVLKLRHIPLASGESASAHVFHVQVDPSIESIETPAGNCRTLRLAFGPEASTWFDVNKPHTLIRYRFGGTEWRLVA